MVENNSQLANLNENISKLENEIGEIKSSEENLKNQISQLNNDLTSKQSIIDKTGLNVFIKNNKRNKGKISFEYKDLDQLNKIIDIIKLNY